MSFNYPYAEPQGLASTYLVILETIFSNEGIISNL